MIHLANPEPDADPDHHLPQRLEWHPIKGLGCVAALFCAIGIFSFSVFLSPLPPSRSDVYLVVALTVAYCGSICVCGFLLWWWQARSCIIADEAGLRWRGMGRWKSATWPQVTGYYLSPSFRPAYIIVTEVGTLHFRKSYVYNTPEILIQIIEQRALNVKTRAWHFQDSGLDEGVCEFVCQESQRDALLLRWAPALLGALVFSVLLLGITCGALFVIPLGFVPVFFIRPIYNLWKRYQNSEEVKLRTGQRISVDAEGITFQRSDHTLYAPWDAVTDYYITAIGITPRAPICHVVVTTQGTFDFVNIENGQRLCRVITRYATNTPQRRWLEHRSVEDLESHQIAPDGALTFSYHTRSTRALLWMYSALPLIFLFSTPFIQWSNSLGYRQPDSDSSLYGMDFLCLVAVVALYWFYRVSHIRLDERGITQYTPIRTTFIAWCGMRKLVIGAPRVGRSVRSVTRVIRFSLPLVDFDLLCKEVERRSGLEWHDKSKNAEQNAALNV